MYKNILVHACCPRLYRLGIVRAISRVIYGHFPGDCLRTLTTRLSTPLRIMYI
nr:hypothetical protein Itr_chr02CG20690 [Ipomoea trifida]